MSSSRITFPFLEPEESVAKQRLAIAQLTYGIPSLLLMLFLFFLIGCFRNYSNSFYRLVQVDLLTNIICWINTWISLRSSELIIGITYVKFLERILPGTWNVSLFLLNFFFHMQFCSAASMSIHRISSILYYQNYEKFWSRYYILVNIIFCIYSFLPQYREDGPKMTLINGTLYYNFDPVHTGTFVNEVAIFAWVYFVLLVGLGISVPVIAARKFQGAITASGVSRKLTRIALTYGFVYSGILLWTVLNTLQTRFHIFPDPFGAISYSMLSVASDLMTLSLPYILLIYDSNIKRDLRHQGEISSTSPVIVSF